MATHWLREITTTATGTGTGFPFSAKCLALFLQNVLGYTNFTETVSGGSFISTEKSGANGSINLSGTDFIFEDTTAAAFAGVDTGKWIVIQDLTNPRNSGIYKATFSTASRVTIDFRSAAAEYPTQNTFANLSWWMLADNYQVPGTTGDFFRLRTPHANGWEIQVSFYDPSSYPGLIVAIAADANWGGSKILTDVYTGADNTAVIWNYCAADTEGEFINFFFHNSTTNEYGGFVAANLDLTEPDRVSSEQVVLMGCRSSGTNIYTNTTYTRDYSDYMLGRGDVWSEKEQHAAQCYMMEASYDAESDGFSGWTSRTVNVRNSNQWDFLGGVPVVVDPIYILYNQNEFEIAGRVKGVLLTSGAAAVRTAHNDTGTRDKFHILDGLAIEWPGVTQQH